jgi:predicted alpha/beta-fold hydrolase
LSIPLSAHLWTVQPRVRHFFLPEKPPPSTPWTGSVEDPIAGSVELSGHLTKVPGSPGIVVLLHGLGGSAMSNYALRGARAAVSAGFSVLRLNMRGVGGCGGDFFHAGLVDDLFAVLGSPELEPFRDIRLLGYSLGGHMALRFATLAEDPRLRCVAAVCSPLDLDACAASFDRPSRWLYRTAILRSLKRTYARIAETRAVPSPVSATKRVKGIREWDDLTVVPRFGFTDAEDYYARMSVGPRLSQLRVPALLVACENDPLVPAQSLKPWIEKANDHLTVVWTDRGGHVGFPADLDLGLGKAVGLDKQAVEWLKRTSASPKSCEESNTR